jgi:nitrogen fixation/metabolism regulation signal transduction histidine kinase
MNAMDETSQDRINEMIEAVMAVAQGNYFIQIRISERNDDLDSLAMGINMMIEDIRIGIEREKTLAATSAAAEAEKKKTRELHALNQQLTASEQRLKAANEQLKIKETELTRKVVEVESFNKLMVGRELDMIDLKAEVNSLLENAGLPKKYDVA